MTTSSRAAGADGLPGDPAIRRATTLVAIVLCLLAVSDASYATTNDGAGEAAMVLAMLVLPLLYVVPRTRPLWLRHRYMLLAAQAALTGLPFVLFGSNWIPGPSGWLTGLVLLTIPPSVSWPLAAALTVIEETVRLYGVGLPFHPGAASAVWIVVAFALNALTLFGLARLADLIAAVHAARDELAAAALNAERLRAADSLRAAVGDHLTAAAGLATAALRAIDRNSGQAREHVMQTAAAARQALAQVRDVAAKYRDAARPEAAPVRAPVTLAPRLAQGVLVAVVCAMAIQDVMDVAYNINDVPTGNYDATIVRWTIVNAVAIAALQLRHSWPSRGASRPRGWPLTLGLQAVLTYAMVPVTGWWPLVMGGFLAGSALLLCPAPLNRIAFAAVIASVPVVWVIEPQPQLNTPQEWLGGMFFLTGANLVFGLLVYGLSRLAWMAVQLDDLRGSLARKAVLGERLRVARDTHDLLGLGLSAIAMKADLIGRLMDRDDDRAGEQIAELARICATARADMRLVTSEARDLPLEAELAAARDVLESAGIDVRARLCASPGSEGGSVLVPVVREAVTNVLKHSSASYCVLEMTADEGLLRLLIGNDGVGGDAPLAEVGRTGSGLGNLAARVEAAGGRLAAGLDTSGFRLVAEIPLGLEPARFGGDTYRVHPVASADLRDRGGQVVAHDSVRQEQFGRDLGRVRARRETP
jgi:two-component system, NarL family, sensor histidine kinase DesK